MWEVTKARNATFDDDERLRVLLANGWEPFAVVGDITYQLVFLRRQAGAELHPEGT